MANRVAAPNLFAPAAPNWSLALLDANAQAATGAINDSSLGATNGPLADTGSVNAYSVTCSLGTPSAYNNGMTVFFNPANTNTGASTLTVSPLASLPIVSVTGSALVGGEIVAGTTTGVVCDGSAFRIFTFTQTLATPAITSVRLRSFNAAGNPSFEVDQANVGSSLTNVATGTRLADRWFLSKAGTMTVNSQQIASGVAVQGTNFWITRNNLRITLTAQEASLAATDQLGIFQNVEGPYFREIYNDVYSLSILARCSVPLKFGVNLRDSPATQSLNCLCTISAANTWTLFQLPNLPVVPSGNFSNAVGTAGQTIRITLAAGSSQMPVSNNVWQSGNLVGAVGQDNFAAQAVNTTFDLAFLQWEPGPQSTTLIDKPFIQNYDECLRYFQKSYDYSTAIGTATAVGSRSFIAPTATGTASGAITLHRPMAKIPTTAIYNWATGAVNSVRDGAGTDHGTAAASNPSTIGFNAVTYATATTGAMPVTFHYTADTGW